MWSLKESQDELNRSIRDLYAVFRRYNKPGYVTGCPHCTTDSDGELLESRPLRDLEWPQLERFAFKALTTMGTLEDFKRFLPRLLELVTSRNPPATVDPQIVLGKLSYADRDPAKSRKRQAFARKEREAIERFLRAWWRRELARDPEDDYSRCDVLESIGCATGDIVPYLAIWSSADGFTAALHLAKLVNSASDEICRSGGVALCYWSKQCDGQLLAWLASARCREMLERPILDGTAGRHADDLSAALSVLESLAAAGR